jgi:hypothetical protein
LREEQQDIGRGGSPLPDFTHLSSSTALILRPLTF